MGISTGGGGHGPKHDINVTPLVDVVLVMLIIFLLAMPIQIRKIAIEVPKELEADVISVSDAITVNLIGKADGRRDDPFICHLSPAFLAARNRRTAFVAIRYRFSLRRKKPLIDLSDSAVAL